MLRSLRKQGTSAVTKGGIFTVSPRSGAKRFRSSIVIDNDDVLVVSKPVGPFQMVS
jgi:hypothetical protein